MLDPILHVRPIYCENNGTKDPTLRDSRIEGKWVWKLFSKLYPLCSVCEKWFEPACGSFVLKLHIEFHALFLSSMKRVPIIEGLASSTKEPASSLIFSLNELMTLPILETLFSSCSIQLLREFFILDFVKKCWEIRKTEYVQIEEKV